MRQLRRLFKHLEPYPVLHVVPTLIFVVVEFWAHSRGSSAGRFILSFFTQFFVITPLKFSISTLSPSDFCMDLVGREHFTKYDFHKSSEDFAFWNRLDWSEDFAYSQKFLGSGTFCVLWITVSSWPVLHAITVHNIYLYKKKMFPLHLKASQQRAFIHTTPIQPGGPCIHLSFSVLRPTMLHDLFYSHDCCCLP
jgi:hypothetical protein